MQILESLTGEKSSIEVYECGCGYHMGVDASYLDRVENIEACCPSCGSMISTADDEDENSEPVVMGACDSAMFSIGGGEENAPALEVKANSVAEGLWLGVEGYQDASTEDFGYIVKLDYWEGRLRVLVWADKENEEPTHIIDLSSAKKVMPAERIFKTREEAEKILQGLDVDKETAWITRVRELGEKNGTSTLVDRNEGRLMEMYIEGVHPDIAFGNII